ncbi:ribosomal RNA small methyltransferase [Salix suchowensis]|nr:ribosomal RNA small methyltransferase [Salix suchowensis]
MKVKAAVAAMDFSPPSHAIMYEDQRIMFKHQSLMQDYDELFLRRRYKYLTQNKSQKPPMKQNLVQPQNLVAASKKLKKEKNSSGIMCLSDCQFHGTTLRNPAPIFDLNKKQRTLIGKEVALRNTSTIPDLNQKERTYSIKEVTIRNSTPVFDLNEVSAEEEEQVNGDMLRTEEPKVSLMRGASDEIHNERKLSACRNVGNGSSRAGKRKITWQDQVALRA